MSSDVRIRVDQFFGASKTLAGSWGWYQSERLNVFKFQREIEEDGVGHGFRLEVNAHMGTDPKEFRYLVTGLGACICRLDCAPVTDGEHVNGPNRPFGLPFAISGFHYHPWRENRTFSTASSLHPRLPYAIESIAKIDTIVQGFWQFCNLVGIDATSADEPDWPKPDRLF